MPIRTAIIAAMPGELKPLVRGWRHEVAQGVDLWTERRGENEWIAACAGAGVTAAARAWAAIERKGRVDRVISVGWAGALGEDGKPGQAYAISEVIDADTGERFRTDGPPAECRLVTSHRVADQVEKRLLATTHGAGLVDMEAAGVARWAASRAIPFYCIKGVSDGLTERLPDFNRFMTKDGRFRLGAFIGFAVIRPWCWPALIRMGKNSRDAAEAVRKRVTDVLTSHESPDR